MDSTTHTTAGLLALAGAARPEALSGHVAYGHHQSASWTVDAIAKPATFMVIDRKNRSTRHLSELSP